LLQVVQLGATRSGLIHAVQSGGWRPGEGQPDVSSVSWVVPELTVVPEVATVVVVGVCVVPLVSVTTVVPVLPSLVVVVSLVWDALPPGHASSSSDETESSAE